jgi:hypothetical protein
MLERVGKRAKGKLELGVYRHGSSVSGMVLVSALGLRRKSVETAEQILSQGGFENELEDSALQALIARRVRVVAELERRHAPAGSYELRRPAGVNMNPDGTMADE